MKTRLVVALMAGLGLVACADWRTASSAREAIDDLAPRPADATQQRAWRRLQLASAYFEQGQDDIAMQEARAALQIDPHQAQAFNLLGLIHQRRHAPDLAEQSFQQALRLASRSPSDLGDIQHNHGWFLCEQAQFDRGQDELMRALQQPGYSARAKTWMVMGDCQLKAGQVAQAQTSWRQALNIDPSNTWLQQRLNPLSRAPKSVE